MRKMKGTIHYICIWAAAAFLLAAGLFCRAGLAEEAPAIPSPTPAPFCPGNVLEIAADFLGDGMDRPYSEGYMPTVEDGQVHIILPLRPADPERIPEAIRVLAAPGEPSVPFILPNYDLRIPYDEAAGIYLIDLEIPLRENAEAGEYSVAFTCSGQADGSSFSQTFTTFTHIPAAPADDPGDAGDAADPADSGSYGDPGAYSDPDPGTGGGGSGGGGGSDPSPETTPAPQPKLMITSQSVAPSPVTAGEGFTLTVTMRNTNARVPIANLLISAEGDGTAVYAADGQNSAYFASIKAGETFSFTVSMMSSPESEPGPKKILLHAGYDGPQGTGYTQEEAATVEVLQPVRFAVDEPEIPSSVAAGEVLSLPVNVMNLGRSSLRNVSAQIEAPGITTQTTLFLGNLESGTAKKGTLSAFVGPKSEDTGKPRYGNTQGVLTVSCEDELGGVHLEELPFSLEISAPVIRSTQTPEEELPEEEPVLAWQSSVIIGAVAAGGAATLWILHRRREKQRDADE